MVRNPVLFNSPTRCARTIPDAVETALAVRILALVRLGGDLSVLETPLSLPVPSSHLTHLQSLLSDYTDDDGRTEKRLKALLTLQAP
jgi:hypothetical protein